MLTTTLAKQDSYLNKHDRITSTPSITLEGSRVTLSVRGQQRQIVASSSITTVVSEATHDNIYWSRSQLWSTATFTLDVPLYR